MARLRRGATAVLTITLGALASAYNETTVKVIVWLLTGLALAVLAWDGASTVWAQERLPWLGRLPLVRDHGLQWRPARPRVYERPPPAFGHIADRPVQETDLSAVLRRLIRKGTEISDEASATGWAGDRQFGSIPATTPDDVDRLLKRETEWVEEVEALLSEDNLERFSGAHAIPATGGYAIYHRMEARLNVLREIRDAL